MTTTPLCFKSRLAPTELVASLAQDDRWQVFWLNHARQPIIGILPTAYFLLSRCDGDLYLYAKNPEGHKKSRCNWANYQHHVQSYFEKQKTTSTQADRYHHGLLGYVSYDVTAAELSDNLQQAYDESEQTLAFFGHFDIYISYDERHYYLHCLREHFDVRPLIKQLITLPRYTPPAPVTLTPFWQKQDYQRAFYKTQDYLKAGDAYQINLTQGFFGVSSTPLSSYLPALYEATNAPCSAYCNIKGHEILSVSPELFLQFKQQKGQLVAITKPIKGTRPRHADPKKDHALKLALKNSEKDLAENVMIVDLLRNDLGKYAKAGGVSTPIKFAIESFSNVHHMVSTVHAVLDNVSALTVLFGSLPAGSVTGSPKKRACELISQLEHKARGAYCGTMGYVNFDGSGSFNVLIRTLQSRPKGDKTRVELWAGGGITVLSAMEEEYQECFDKACQILDILQDPSQGDLTKNLL